MVRLRRVIASATLEKELNHIKMYDFGYGNNIK